MVSAPDSTPPTIADRDRYLAEFNALNSKINTALEKDDCDAILALIEQRAPIVEALVSIHKTLPFPKDIAEEIAALEQDFQQRVSTLKINVGNELRKAVHSAQSVNKYKKISDETSLD